MTAIPEGNKGRLDSPTDDRNTSETSGDDMPAWAREAIEAALTADQIIVNMPPQSGASTDHYVMKRNPS